MPVINTPPTPTPPTPLTLAQKQQKAARQIVARNTSLFNAMVSTYTTNMETVWNNKDGLTPQQVLSAFGTSAGELVTLASELAFLLNATSANSVVASAPEVLTINPDGSVTVGEGSQSNSSTSSESN